MHGSTWVAGIGAVALTLAACSSSHSTTPTTVAATTTTVPAPPLDYAAPGSLDVATFSEVIPDDGEGRPLQVTVWHPVDDGASHPLLVLTPGLGGSPTTYTALAEHFASYGFVVIGAGHGDQFEGAEEATVALLYDRPRDIVREIAFADELTASGGELAGQIDTEHIGIFGHSSGGTTTFQAGGARVDFAAEARFCADKGDDPQAGEACQFLGQHDVLAQRLGATGADDELLPAIADPRVDALVAMAPGGELRVFGEDGIAAVDVPTLILQGDADEFLSLDYNAYWAYDHIGSADKSMAVFAGGSHLMFLDCCGFDAAAGGPRFEDLYPHLATAFFLDVLTGDAAARAALVSDAVRIAGVAYTTTR